MKYILSLLVVFSLSTADAQQIEFPFSEGSFNEIQLKQRLEAEDFEWLEKVAAEFRAGLAPLSPRRRPAARALAGRPRRWPL